MIKPISVVLLPHYRFQINVEQKSYRILVDVHLSISYGVFFFSESVSLICECFRAFPLREAIGKNVSFDLKRTHLKEYHYFVKCFLFVGLGCFRSHSKTVMGV